MEIEEEVQEVQAALQDIFRRFQEVMKENAQLRFEIARIHQNDTLIELERMRQTSVNHFRPNR